MTTTKAAFFCTDTADLFEVQYNPRDLDVRSRADWVEHSAQGGMGQLEFQKISPATLQIELHFDTTAEQTDVREVWLNRLANLTRPAIRPESGQAQKMSKERPPIVVFLWGTICMKGIVESIDTRYLRFSAQGIPLRARAVVSMKQWGGQDAQPMGHAYGPNGTYWPLVVTPQTGQTLSNLAVAYGTTAQAIGEANGLDDLMDIESATSLLIPSRR